MTILARERVLNLAEGATSVSPIPVRVKIANHSDVCRTNFGLVPKHEMRQLEIPASVRPGMFRITVPAEIASELGLMISGSSRVVFPDGHSEVWPIAQNLRLELCGRADVFSAIVDPHCHPARIGSMVLDVLDLVIDCAAMQVRPRDPSGITIDI